jgi:hypothetical protein
MKRLSAFFVIISVSALVLQGFANTPQEQTVRKKDVPKPILEAFQKAYPKATIKGFSRETDQGQLVYEVESSEEKVNRDITYTPDGTVVSIEETLPVDQLPSAVRSSLEKEFPKAKISKAEKITKGSTTHYEFLFRLGKKKTQEIVLDSDGKIVKTEKK